MKRCLIAALAVLAACSPTPQAPAEPEAVALAPCGAFDVIGPGAEACGVALTAESGVTVAGVPQQGGAPLIVTSGVEKRAQSLMIYPSPGGRFLLARGCEGAPADPGICWRTLLIDRQNRAMKDLTLRSHYGPTRDIYWSPDNARFALIEPMEGFEAVTLVNPESGAIASFPAEGGADNWKADEASIRWTGPAELSLSAELCNGNSGRCAAPSLQTLTAP